MNIAGIERIGVGREHRFLGLLIAVVAMLLFSPLIEGGTAQQELVVALTALVLIAAGHAASRRHNERLFVIGLAVPWAFIAGFGLLLDTTVLLTLADTAFAILCGLTTIIALRHVATAERVTMDVLCGAAAVYLLIGLTWAVTYGLIETLSPGALALTNPDVQMAWTQVLYFSFTTLTTLGYGDILPVHSFVRVWATMEAVAGTFYMALLVARLVGLYAR